MLKVGNPVTRWLIPLTVQRCNLGTVGFWGIWPGPWRATPQMILSMNCCSGKGTAVGEECVPTQDVKRKWKNGTSPVGTKFQCSALLRQGLQELRLTLNSLDNQRKPWKQVLKLVPPHILIISFLVFKCVWRFACLLSVPPCRYSALGDQKKVLGLIGQQLQRVVGHYVGAGNWSPVLFKSNQCS